MPLADVKALIEAHDSRRDGAAPPMPAVATTAFSLPGHLVVAEPEALASEHLLGQAMLTACAILKLSSPHASVITPAGRFNPLTLPLA